MLSFTAVGPLDVAADERLGLGGIEGVAMMLGTGPNQ